MSDAALFVQTWPWGERTYSGDYTFTTTDAAAGPAYALTFSPVITFVPSDGEWRRRRHIDRLRAAILRCA